VASIVPFQDFDDSDPDIEFRRRRWKYWQGLETTRLEYMNSLIPLGKKFDERDFKTYIEETYGIQLHEDAGGSITDTYDIVDEKKYLVFFLKWL
jgi:hypothetical protein